MSLEILVEGLQAVLPSSQVHRLQGIQESKHTFNMDKMRHIPKSKQLLQ